MIPKGNNSFDGYCIDLLHEIQGVLKFDYELYPSPDGLVGSMDDQGQWNGVVKELMEKVRGSYLGERKNKLYKTCCFYLRIIFTLRYTVTCYQFKQRDFCVLFSYIYINK